MFTKTKELFMNWKINYTIIKDVFVKLGLFSITGGVIGYIVDNKIDALTAFYAIFIGIFFILAGATHSLKKEE